MVLALAQRIISELVARSVLIVDNYPVLWKSNWVFDLPQSANPLYLIAGKGVTI